MEQIDGLAQAILSCVEEVCVIDEDTRTVLYMSGTMERERFPGGTGEKCHRVLFDREEPCPFCPALLPPGEGEEYGPLYAWENYSPVLGKWLRIKNRLVRLEGRLCRVGNLNTLGDAMELSRDAILEMAVLQEQKKVYQRLAEDLDFAASHDAMTGLYNRARYLRDLEVWFVGGESAGAVFFDLNNLKQVNDRYGHDKGDALLRRLGHVLAWLQGELVRAYRIGGDEFILLCRDCGEELLGRLDAAAREALAFHEEEEPPCSVASGTAWERTPLDPEALVARADQQMYRNKQAMKAADR